MTGRLPAEKKEEETIMVISDGPERTQGDGNRPHERPGIGALSTRVLSKVSFFTVLIKDQDTVE